MMILHIASQTMGFDERVDCIEFGICDVASFRWDGVVIIRHGWRLIRRSWPGGGTWRHGTWRHYLGRESVVTSVQWQVAAT